MGIVSTNKLAQYPADGFFVVSFDEDWYRYHGMTEQANGDVLVHLTNFDTGATYDVGVAKVDRDQPFWQA